MESIKYKIKEKYKSFIVKYSWSKLDLNSVYTKEEWNSAGFKDSILEKIN